MNCSDRRNKITTQLFVSHCFSLNPIFLYRWAAAFPILEIPPSHTLEFHFGPKLLVLLSSRVGNGWMLGSERSLNGPSGAPCVMDGPEAVPSGNPRGPRWERAASYILAHQAANGRQVAWEPPAQSNPQPFSGTAAGSLEFRQPTWYPASPPCPTGCSLTLKMVALSCLLALFISSFL